MPIVTDFADIKRRMDALSNPPQSNAEELLDALTIQMLAFNATTKARIAEFDANAAKIDARLTDMETRFPSHWAPDP